MKLPAVCDTFLYGGARRIQIYVYVTFLINECMYVSVRNSVPLLEGATLMHPFDVTFPVNCELMNETKYIKYIYFNSVYFHYSRILFSART